MALMKDSKLDENWLRQMIANNPPSLRENGNIVSGPVRLAFTNLLRPGKPGKDQTEGKFGAAVLFTPGANMQPYSDMWTRTARQYFPTYFDQSGNPHGLHSPFHDQQEKAFGQKPLAGYTPGCIHFTASSKFKPAVVDMNQNPIVDEAQLYSGMWAIVACNVYHYGLSPPQPKKGVSFGLQTVMKIADDVRLVGGGGDPKADFGHIKITAQSNIAAKFDGLPGAAGQPASVLLPGMGGQGTMGSMPIHELAHDGLTPEELAELAELTG